MRLVTPSARSGDDALTAVLSVLTFLLALALLADAGPQTAPELGTPRSARRH